MEQDMPKTCQKHALDEQDMLPIDSPGSGDELKKKSHRKKIIFSRRKMFLKKSSKKFRDFFDFFQKR